VAQPGPPLSDNDNKSTAQSPLPPQPPPFNDDNDDKAVTTQSSVHMRGMPTVSFTKAIDVWMATCLVFVFGSFIEYSVVNVLARREKGRREVHAAPAHAAGTSRIVLPVALHNVDHQPKVR